MYRTAILVALFAAATAGEAGHLLPLQAHSIELGSIRGIAYYTEAPDGFRVVTTLAEGETGLPVRFEATLTDKQSLTISIPGKWGEPGEKLEILRNGNELVVSDALPAGNDAVASAPKTPDNE